MLIGFGNGHMAESPGSLEPHDTSKNTKLKNKLKPCSKSNPEEVPNEIDDANTVPLQKEFEKFRDFVCGKLDVLFDALNGINDDSDTSSSSSSSPSPSSPSPQPHQGEFEYYKE